MIKILLAAAATLSVAQSATFAAEPAMSSRSHDSAKAETPPVPAVKPDILLIMPDQMRGDCLSSLGHPVVQTPNMDKLAADGVMFRRGYSTCPSCIPARYALLTGMSPQASGVVGYASKKFDTPTLPAVLGEAGYTTVLVGRNMHQTYIDKNMFPKGPNQTHGYQREIEGSTYVDDDEYGKFLRKSAPDSGGIRKVIEDSETDCGTWRASAWPLDDALHPTAWTVKESEKIIAETPGDKPLFLTASFYAPHPPLFAPKKYFDAILRNEYPKPAHGTWEKDWDKLSPSGSVAGSRIRLEGELLRRAHAGYYGLIDHLDAEIAPLIADFKARSEKAKRPWIIVVYSDHGEMLGDHGYFRKCEPYEGSANVPFIVTGSPELGFKTGMRKTQPATLEDLMPTLLALAHVPKPEKVDGVNLLPALRDPAAQTRDVLHIEHATAYSRASHSKWEFLRAENPGQGALTTNEMYLAEGLTPIPFG